MKIVVIETFGLHLGYLGFYGNEWVATPNLDRLANDGVVFDWHFADQPELLPSAPWHERSVGTGNYAAPGQLPRTSALPTRPRVAQCEELATFAEQALQNLTTNEPWLWIEGPNLAPPWRLEADLLESYFDEDDVEEGLEPWPDPPREDRPLTDAQTLRLQNTYAAAVTFFDAQLGKILEQGIDKDETLLCVTSRSGLPLGEHGMIGTPRPKLHDELVHVPLLLRMPRGQNAGLRVAALTQPIDLTPTFLDFLGQPMPPCAGRSLWPLLRGEAESVRPYALSMLRVGAEESWLMRTPTRALHLPIAPADARPQWFIKPEDRWEVNDLYSQQIEAADELEKSLRAAVDDIRQS